MKNTMLAILAVALAALAPFAMAAEGQGDNDADGNKQPTMAELGNKVDSIVRQLGSLSATTGSLRTELGTLRTELGALATTVGTLSSTVSANHTTIVGKFAPQMAVVMTVPTTRISSRSDIPLNYRAAYYLVGESTIPGFPADTVAADGSFDTAGTLIPLPAGTYLIEVQHPYSDNVLCQSSVSRRGTGANEIPRFNSVCPWLRVAVNRGGPKIDDGFGIASSTLQFGLFPTHRFPIGFTFTDDKPASSYTAAFKITKLK